MEENVVEEHELMDSSERKLWEFNRFITCRLIALVFRQSGLKKIYKRFGVQYQGKLENYGLMHHALTESCTEPNRISEYVDMLLRKRLNPYRSRLTEFDQNEICHLIESHDRYKEAPLPALIWFAVRKRCENIDEIEHRLLNILHSKELLALSFYNSTAFPPDVRMEDIEIEIRKALETGERLRKEKQKVNKLRLAIQTIEKEKSNLELRLAKERSHNEELRKEIEALGGESSIKRIKELEEEVTLLTREIEKLTQELIEQDWLPAEPEVVNEPYAQKGKEDRESNSEFVNYDKEVSIEGKTVFIVGGIDSLESHYKSLVENLGGIFYRHNGKSSPRSKDEIENLVNKADMILCPIDITSHSAVRCVRSACKSRNKLCCFLRSSSLSMLRRALADFAEEDTSL
jgi:hypothetical protein